jgi:ribosomal protein S18 acetylase RimI-like enzyme
MLVCSYVDRAGVAELLREMAAWTPAGAPADTVHIGDLGWHLRFEDEIVAGTIVRWDRGGDLVAVAIREETSAWLALAPSVGTDPVFAAEFAPAVTALLGAGEARLTVAPDWPVAKLLGEAGWETELRWPVFVRDLAAAPAWPSGAELVTPQTAAERVAVQRSAFDGSTFSVPRWEQMMSAPAGEFAVDLLVRDADGYAAAAATAWFAGTGRCGLLEPVGTHADHRGRGHGRTVVLAACGALAQRGASAAAVVTPETNGAGVRLYLSAGFDIVRHDVILRRAR